MELNEFKELWQLRAHSSALADKYNSEKINEIIMKANTTVGKLHSTNISWWNFSKISIAILIASLALNIITFLINPERFPQFKTALPFLGIIAVYGLITLWIYYEQVKIFDMKDSPNLLTAIESSIRRFDRFYVLITMLNVVMLPVVFYVGSLLVQMGFHRVELVLSTREVVQSISLTLVVMIGSHIYYKKTYFKWLSELKNNLTELKSEGSSNH